MNKVPTARARILVCLIFIATVFAVFCLSLPVGSPAYADDVTVISTAEEMIAFSAESKSSSFDGKTVELADDIVLPSTFSPIGSSDCYFEGTFNGNGHTLTVSIVNSTGATGVFAYTGSNCTVTGLVVKGSVSGSKNVGGIVGSADGSKIKECVSLAIVEGDSNVGGIVGYCSGSVSSCASFSSVSAKTTIGGVVGLLQTNASSIVDTVYFGNINVKEGGTIFGGLVGNSSGTLRDNYTLATFSGSIYTVYGSVVGTLSSVGSGVSYCYGIDSTRSAVGNNASGSSPATLTTKSLYELLSGNVTFSPSTKLASRLYDVGFGYYPCPSYMLNDERTAFVTAYEQIGSECFKVCLFSSGAGTEGDPFRLSAAEEWKLFVVNSHLYDYDGKHVVLDNSLNIGEIDGVGSVDKPFAGTLDGNGNNVSYRSSVIGVNKGLFTVLEGATIKNLVVTAQVAGGNYTGGLAGLVTGSALTSAENVTVTENSGISGGDHVGGLFGGTSDNVTLTVIDCSSSAVVAGTSYVGGIFGSADGTVTCRDTHNHGTINCSSNGGRYVGGVFGRLSGTLTLSGDSDSGLIQANKCTSVGGVGGGLSAPSGARIPSCYATANVTGRYNVGGIFGEVSGNIILASCAYIGTVKGGNNLGGLVGKVPAPGDNSTALTVNDCYFVGNFEKDKSVALTEAYRAFCVASPETAATDDLSSGSPYEYDAVAESFVPTTDVTPQAGKQYYSFLSTLTLNGMVYYNSDVYFGVNTNGAVGKNTIELSDGDLSVFSEADDWETTTTTYASGFYPVPKGASTEGFSVAYFAGGEGTEQSPILISTERQLRNFGNMFNGYAALLNGKYFSQTNNIALTRDFFVISRFDGVYNGNGYAVSSVKISSSATTVGFFGEAYGTLKNISLEGKSIVSLSSEATVVGGLVAICQAEVYRCYAALNVSAATGTDYVGGLIGSTSNNVTTSFFAGTVSGGECVGGLVGRLSVGTVLDCFTTGRVVASVCAGGIIGMNNGAMMEGSSTNVVLELTGTAATCSIGGLVGVNNTVGGETSGRLRACLSNARLIYSGSVKAGGLVGDEKSGNVIIYGEYSCYYNEDYAPSVAADASTTSTAGILRTEMRAGVEIRTFSVHGFTTEGLNYYNARHDARYAFRPTTVAEWANDVYQVDLYSKMSAEMVMWQYDYAADESDPRGSENNPYLITCAEELSYLSASTLQYAYKGTYFRITSDLDMDEVDVFYPIGFYRDFDDNRPFNGTIDGAGHTIRNLMIDFYAYVNLLGREETDNRYVALFGFTGTDFRLKRLVLDQSCKIYGGQYSASFVGYFQGTLDECLSYAEIHSIALASVTASTYETNTYYERKNGGYELSSTAFDSTKTYYTTSSNVGGLAGGLASAGNAIVSCVFGGTLPDVPVAFGFVGMNDTSTALSTTDSWYLTNNAAYAYDGSYGRALVDFSDGENGGKVVVINDWDDRGFAFVLTAGSSFYPFVYNANGDALSVSTYTVTASTQVYDLSGGGLTVGNDYVYYRLSSSNSVRYQIRFCQEVTFSIVGGTDGSDVILTSEGDKPIVSGGVTRYYYYKGQTGSVKYAWKKSGYYLDENVRVDGNVTGLWDAIANESDDVVYTFTMGVTNNASYLIEVTVKQVLSKVNFSGSANYIYDRTTKDFGYTVDSSFGSEVVCISNATGQESTLHNAGTYTVRVYLLNGVDGEVRIGMKETSCTIDPKILTVSGGADFSAYARKDYDGTNTKRVSVTDASVFDGICAGDETSFGAATDQWYVTLLITWDNADSGTNKSYSISSFEVSGTGNYAFSGGYSLSGAGFSDGIIDKHVIYVAIESASDVTFGSTEYSLYEVDYSGRQPDAPFASSYAIGWKYYAATIVGEELTPDMSAEVTSFGVGYYIVVPTLSDEDNVNNVLNTHGKTFCMRVLPYVVTQVNFDFNTLRYNGQNLASQVRTYFAGVGGDGETMRATAAYFVRVTEPTESDYLAGNLYVRNDRNTHFVQADSFAEGQLYYASTQLLHAGTYFVDCGSENANYDVQRTIYELSVNKAIPVYGLTFTLSVGGADVADGDTVKYNAPMKITFTDALSRLEADASYDAMYRVDYISRNNGGRLDCYQEGGEWFVLPSAYGTDIVFTITSYGASDYENRTSETEFTISVEAIVMYVGLARPEQVFGDVLDFSLQYYYLDGTDKVYVEEENIVGLNAPVVSTGARTPEKAGVYNLIYNGGTSSGYLFNTTVVPMLTITPRQIYVSVPSGLSNSKVYGNDDPDIRYYVYSDAGCTQIMESLPNGKEIVLVGSPARTEGEDVGSYSIESGTIALSSNNPDYNVTYVAGTGKFVIMYRDIYLCVKEGQGKNYGDEDQPYELETEEGYSMARGDVITTFTYGENACVFITREQGEDVGSYGYSVRIDYVAAGKGNYNVIGVTATAFFRISRAKPTILYSFDGTVFFGDSTDNVSSASARAYLDEKPVRGTFEWTRKVFDSMNPARIELNFIPEDTRNYSSALISLVVVPQKRVVYPVFDGTTEYTYTGAAQTAPAVGLEGTVEGNNQYVLTSSISGDNVNATQTGFTVTVLLTSEYYIFETGDTVEVKCRISPATLIVRVENAVISEGEEYTPSITYAGFVGEETESVLLKRAAVTSVPTESGVYTVTASGATANNYTFDYRSGVLTVNKLTVENDGISVAGSFAPNLTVDMNVFTEGQAFEDMQSVYDKKLGGHLLLPLKTQMTAYYNVRFSSVTDENDVYTYSIALAKDIPAGAKLYLCSETGELSVLDDYEIEDGNIVFKANAINCMIVYEEKDQATYLKGFIPLALIVGGVVLVFMLIGIITYFRKMRGGGGKNVYRAERASYRNFPHRK